MYKRLLATFAVITLSTALLIGCGKKQEEATQTTTETAETTTPEESTPAQTEEVTATPEETADPATESTPEPSEEPVSEIETTNVETTDATETEQTETAEQNRTETSSAEQNTEYTYTDMTAIMYAQQEVNVRALPDTSGNKLGSLSTNEEITVTGQCNETGWYRFDYNGQVAYVNHNYISADMVPVQQQATTGNASSANTYDLGDGIPRQYGVLYVNTCGLQIEGGINADCAIPSQGPFPYPLYTVIDNGDGTYTCYEVHNHSGFIDGVFFDFSTAKNDAFNELLYSQGYRVVSSDRYAWESCVGGYDEGCIHRFIVQKNEY